MYKKNIVRGFGYIVSRPGQANYTQAMDEESAGVAMASREKQRILDGIEALYPADSATGRSAFIGQILLHHALENTYYNWRDLPVSVLARYLAICEDYERKSLANASGENPADNLPSYLKH